MKSHRIAKLKNGDEYVVNRVDFRSMTVYCWGEVTKAVKGPAGVRLTHTFDVVKFPKHDVEIYELSQFTEKFAHARVVQAQRNLQPMLDEQRLTVSDQTMKSISNLIRNAM
jgi:hypothetical protein